MKLLSNIIGLGLLVLSAIFMLVMFSYFFATDAKNLEQALVDSNVNAGSDVGLYVSIAYSVVVMVAVAFAILFGAVTNPTVFLRSIISSVVIGVLFLICYAISDNEVTEVYKQFNVSPQLSQSIGGGLILSYIMILISGVAILASEVVSIIRG